MNKYARKVFTMELHFTGWYIADPYWPEKQEFIEIQKQSGVNRARSEKTRADALAVYLKKTGMAAEEYAALEARAAWPWYRAGLTNNLDDEIVIHSHQLYGCLIRAADTCPAALRPCPPENLRTAVRLDEFYRTGKYKEDGMWSRTVQPKDGQGNPLSNQRGLRTDPFISDFHIKGSIGFYADQMRENGENFQEFLSWAGERIGVGAARKMDCGRFVVEAYREQ